jgi:hypothetical protein
MSVNLTGNMRRLTRRVLCFYLKVIDLESGKELGRICDITSEGMMIFGNNALNKDKIYRIRVILGTGLFSALLGNLDVSVQVRWSKPDANPALILTGLYFCDLDEKGKKIVKNLVNKIGMKRPLDLTEEDIENGFTDNEEI